MLRPSEIKASPDQPRKSFDEYELKALSDSIQASGIIQPLIVRKTPEGGYLLIAGERRLKAAVMAGLRRVPCVVHKTNDETAALYSLLENLQRSNLTVFAGFGINDYRLPCSWVFHNLNIAFFTAYHSPFGLFGVYTQCNGSHLSRTILQKNGCHFIGTCWGGLPLTENFTGLFLHKTADY